MAAAAVCNVGLKMQESMSQFWKRGLFNVLPQKMMQIRVGVHSDSGFATMTGMSNFIHNFMLKAFS
jgi:hypothetical protein